MIAICTECGKTCDDGVVLKLHNEKTFLCFDCFDKLEDEEETPEEEQTF